MLTHIARDQFGKTWDCFTDHPRKELLEQLGRRHADKIYVDRKDGSARHVGWIIAGLWLTVWKVRPIEERTT
jgi:hypothetical protein